MTNLSSGQPPCASDIGLAYDPVLWEFVSFGGVNGCARPGYGFDGNATWTWDNGTWTNISAGLSHAPSPRYGMAVAWDPQANAIVAYGGAGPTGVSYNDTWEFNGSWNNETSNQSMSPAPVFQAGLVYDPTLDGMLLVDGDSSQCGCNVNQTYLFHLGQWSNVTASYLPPAVHSTMVWYDTANGSVLLYGGVTNAGTISPETWSWTGGSWTQLFPSTAPPAVYDGAAVYDPVLGAPLLFGGYTAPVPTFSPAAGTWAFVAGTWSNLSGSIAGSPSPRGGARAAFDPATNVTLLYGGRLAAGLTLADDSWELFSGNVSTISAALSAAPNPILLGANTTLTTIASGGAGPYTYTYTGLPSGCAPANVSALLCTPTASGTVRVSVNVTDPAGAFAVASTNVTVLLPTNAAWINITDPNRPIPPCTSDPALAYDPALSEFVSFGGVTGCGISSSGADGNATWTFSNGTWTNVSGLLPTAPSPRYGMAAAYDPEIGAIVAFGGAGPFGGPMGDTWIFNGTWTQLTNLTSAPRAGYQASEVYDPAIQAVVLVDGGNPGGANQNATWEFANWAWTNLSLTVLPPAVHSFQLWYVPPTQSVLMFGGVTNNGTISNETWQYENGSWSQLFPTNSPPPTYDGAPFYDGAPILFGGYGAPVPAFGPESGTWSFANDTWTNLSASLAGGPSPRGGARAAFDPAENWTLLFGGRLSAALVLSNDTWGYPTVPLMGTISVIPPELDLGTHLTVDVDVLGGARPYSFQYLGLPSGCAGGNVSVVTCVPTENGTFSITATVSDPVGASFAATGSVTIFPRLTADLNASRGVLEIGQSVNFTATAGGGAGGYSFVYANLPIGCAAGGEAAFTCTPTGSGNYSVTASVTDRLGVVVTSAAVNVTVLGPLQVSLAVSSPIADVGETVTYTATVTGGLPSYTASYRNLPLGCASTASLAIDCSPSTPGNFSTSVEVTDGLGVQAVSSVAVLTVAPSLAVALPAPFPVAEVGVPIVVNATVEGGSAPFTFRWTGVPAGCVGADAALGCNATSPGNSTVGLQVEDATFATANASARFVIVPALVAWLNASRTTVDVGVPFSLMAAMFGGASPFSLTWNLSGVSCTPDGTQAECQGTTVGIATERVSILDGLGGSAHASVTLRIGPALETSLSAKTVASCTAPFEVRLIGGSTGGIGPYLSDWSFGDGTSASNASATIVHNYTMAGTYTAEYSVTDAGGGASNASVTVTVAADSAACPSSAAPGTSLGAAAIWALLAGIALVVGLALVLALRRRRPASDGPDAPAPVEPPAPAPADEGEDRIYGGPPPT